MKIAIVGTGISGMYAAYLLAAKSDIIVFEANDYIGGHSHTVEVSCQKKTYPIDTGFIVYNHKTYPLFSKLIEELNVKAEDSSMSFGIKADNNGLEYGTASLNGIFAQRRNLLNPAFYRIFFDVMRFNREAPKLLLNNSKAKEAISLRQYLHDNHYSDEFRQYYIVPMAAAIWSAKNSTIEEYPIIYLVRFFQNHGILSNYRHLQWQTITGGSQEYVKKLTQSFAHKIRLKCPVLSIKRNKNDVEVNSKKYGCEKFDKIIMATHSDQALRLLKDPSAQEKNILGSIAYQENEAILHTDASVLPKSQRAWASWNYHIFKKTENHPASLTYYMNRLQNLNASKNFCVTLNYPKKINKKHIIQKMIYHHPVFTPEALLAQQQHHKINGINHTYFCGAYWGHGFHEDGAQSALKVVQKINSVRRIA